jgi:nucleoside-diphosphate-sugar epimerase
VPRAVVLGGTGLIGSAVARRLLAAGWRVDLTGRDPSRMPPELAAAGGRFAAADRADPGRLAAVVGSGADLLVDCLCYTAADARTLLPLLADVGSAVMISGRAVYADAHGNHVNSPVKPRFDAPVRETQPTVAPGDGPYDTAEGYGANKVAAEQVLLECGAPVTVVRPSTVHGLGAARSREWVFVKRVLDRRPAVLLARRGACVVHQTSAANLAALIETVAGAPGRRILNCADPDAPTVLEISRIVARRLGHDWREVLLDEAGEDGAPALGRTPWDAPHPMLLDTSAATALGYTPVGNYAATVAGEIDRLAAAVRAGRDPGAADRAYFARFFDYPAEDRYLAAVRAEPHDAGA